MNKTSWTHSMCGYLEGYSSKMNSNGIERNFEHFAPCIRSRFIDTGLDQRYDIILPNQIWFYNAQCTIFGDIYRVVVLINHYHIHHSHTHGQKHKHIYEYRNVNCAFLLVMSNDT